MAAAEGHPVAAAAAAPSPPPPFAQRPAAAALSAGPVLRAVNGGTAAVRPVSCPPDTAATPVPRPTDQRQAVNWPAPFQTPRYTVLPTLGVSFCQYVGFHSFPLTAMQFSCIALPVECTCFGWILSVALVEVARPVNRSLYDAAFGSGPGNESRRRRDSNPPFPRRMVCELKVWCSCFELPRYTSHEQFWTSGL